MSPDFSGVWKTHLQRSKLLGSQPTAVLAKIKQSEEELAAEMVITKADGCENSLVFKGRTSGEQITNVVQGVEMRSRLQWVDNELLIESWVNVAGRQGHFLDYRSFSNDGQTLIMEHRGDDLAGQITFLQKMH